MDTHIHEGSSLISRYRQVHKWSFLVATLGVSRIVESLNGPTYYQSRKSQVPDCMVDLLSTMGWSGLWCAFFYDDVITQ